MGMSIIDEAIITVSYNLEKRLRELKIKGNIEIIQTKVK